jgi:ABC-2 type transport system permease protein
VVCFAALGVALSHAIPNSESAPAYVNAVFIPMLMVAGVFYEDEDAPAVIRELAQVLPLKHLVDGLSGAMVRGEGVGSHGVALLVIGIWGVAGAVLAIRGFSWEQRRH